MPKQTLLIIQKKDQHIKATSATAIIITISVDLDLLAWFWLTYKRDQDNTENF